ncbi:MAG: 5-(carboxyamino)imidazole ribonucleotide synthase, partial [Achromobacter piechaudii]
MSQSTAFMITPGGWLGLLGGGQLGRMFCHAAQSLGYKVAVLDPADECPAGMVADLHIQAAYDDEAGLARLAQTCQAVTTEFENVPAQSLRTLATRCRVSPAADAVAIVQDRIAEKTFIASQGIAVAPHAAIRAEADLRAAPDALFPGILKVARLGYDGKGQARINTREEALAAFAEFGGVACVLEALMPLDYEISVVLARGFDGASVVFPVARNVHRDGILAVSTAAPVQSDAAHAERQARATEAAQSIAQGLGYHGVLCVEFFVLKDGSLIVNEIAPRPHNSGHYTMNACVTSQF